MSEVFYVCKPTRGPQGADLLPGPIIGYEVKYETNSRTVPRGDFEVLLGDASYLYAKAEEVVNPTTGFLEWRVVEDTVTKAAAEAEAADRQAKHDAVLAVRASISTATSIPELRAIVLAIYEDLYG